MNALQLWSVDSIMRRRKRPEVLRDFIHKHRKYRDKENKNKWITNDPMQRLNWHDDLTAIEELESEVSIVNEINCPDCNQMISSMKIPTGCPMAIIIVKIAIRN